MPPQRNYHPIVVSIVALLDLACAALGLGIAVYLTDLLAREGEFAARVSIYINYGAAYALAWPFAATLNRLYVSRRRDDLITLIFDATKAVAMSLIFSGFIVSFYNPRGADPVFVSWFGVSTLGLVLAFRILLQLLLWWWRRRGHDERHILIVGINERAKELIEVLSRSPHYGYRISGVLDDDPARCRMIEEYNLPYLGKFDALEEVLTRHIVDEVFICLPVRSRYETIQSMAMLCEGIGVSVRMLADLFPLRLATSRFTKMDGIPILALSTVPEHQPQLLAQRLTDIFVSLIALILLSPVFLITAIAIKLDSRGPVFFLQERVGLNRRHFKMIKFRSMVADAETLRKEMERMNEKEGPIFKISKDPRVTRVGRFIRKYSIDELPQLINVLLGDMSLVGPRPPLPKEVAQYSWNQRRRLSVKPGMTGLSQVRGRSDLSFKETVDLDLYYIDQWSLALVFRILLLTIPAVLRGRGAV